MTKSHKNYLKFCMILRLLRKKPERYGNTSTYYDSFNRKGHPGTVNTSVKAYWLSKEEDAILIPLTDSYTGRYNFHALPKSPTLNPETGKKYNILEIEPDFAEEIKVMEVCMKLDKNF